MSDALVFRLSYDACLSEATNDDLEHARAALMREAIDRVRELEAERDALKAALVQITGRAETASRFDNDRYNFGWMVKQALEALALIRKEPDND